MAKMAAKALIMARTEGPKGFPGRNDEQVQPLISSNQIKMWENGQREP